MRIAVDQLKNTKVIHDLVSISAMNKVNATAAALAASTTLTSYATGNSNAKNTKEGPAMSSGFGGGPVTASELNMMSTVLINLKPKQAGG